MAGQGRSYEYDAIGNRREFHRDVALAAGAGGAVLGNLEQVSMSYGINALNQVDEVTPSVAAVEISGLTHAAVPEVAVGVLAQGAAAGAEPSEVTLPSGQLRPPGNGEPGGYALWLASGGAGDGGELGRWPVVAVTARQASVVTGEPGLSQTQRGRVRVPWATAWEHDADGNLGNDGEWQCGWNADNQLTSVERIAAGLPLDVPLVRLEHHYDWLGRRVVTVKKEKRSLDGSAPRAEAWSVVETRHFWYDGWNLMAETVQGGATGSVAVATQRYAWGTDLGGTWETGLGNAGPGASRTAAGGVGALLGVRSAAVPEKERLRQAGGGSYSVCQDANGNVMGFIDLETGALAARFDYDAFGNVITDWSAPGQDAGWISRIRFSGKWQEAEMGWVYYGYRWYLPEVGRWASKDPIGEKGGFNLYGFNENDGVNSVDRLGHKKKIIVAFAFEESSERATPVRRGNESWPRGWFAAMAGMDRLRRSLDHCNKFAPSCKAEQKIADWVPIEAESNPAPDTPRSIVPDNPELRGLHEDVGNPKDKDKMKDVEKRIKWPANATFKVLVTGQWPGGLSMTAGRAYPDSMIILNMEATAGPTLPHEIGHVMKWREPGTNSTHSQDPNNLMSQSESFIKNPDCQWCTKIYNYAK